MKVAVLLQDREAAGKTEPALIQVGKRKLVREDYYKFIEHYGVSEAEFLEMAVNFLDGAGADGEVERDMAHVSVRDAPMTERQGAYIPDPYTTSRNGRWTKT